LGGDDCPRPHVVVTGCFSRDLRKYMWLELDSEEASPLSVLMANVVQGMDGVGIRKQAGTEGEAHEIDP